MDDDFETSERISEDLKRRIRFLVKRTRKNDGGWDDVVDEIVSRFFPNLSKMENLYVDALFRLHEILNPCVVPAKR